MSRKAEIAIAAAFCLVGLVPSFLDMAGIETSGILVPYMPVISSVFKVLSPFALIAGGILIGLMLHKASGENERRRDEAAARIERDAAEHAEKMRREREEYEAAKAREEEEREAAEAERAKELAHKRRLDAEANEFKGIGADSKMIVCKAYDDGSVVLSEKLRDYTGDRYWQACGMMTCETLPDGRYRYTLNRSTRELIDAHPEIIEETREFMEAERARERKKAARKNPGSVLSQMTADELSTLQALVDNGGRIELADEAEDAHLDTLQEYNMVAEHWDSPMEQPVYELDNKVLEFFRREENKDLIAMHIGEKVKAEEL